MRQFDFYKAISCNLTRQLSSEKKLRAQGIMINHLIEKPRHIPPGAETIPLNIISLLFTLCQLTLQANSDKTTIEKKNYFSSIFYL